MNFLKEWFNNSVILLSIAACIACIGGAMFVFHATYNYAFNMTEALTPKIIWSLFMIVWIAGVMTLFNRIPGNVKRTTLNEQT